MGKPKPPAPPDPVAVANAQSAANIASAKEQQALNMVGTSGPQGTVYYKPDATQPGGYTQVTTLSPQEQAIYDRQHTAETGALDVANEQLGRVRDALGTPLDTNGLPSLHGGGQLSVGRGTQYGFDHGHALQYGFDPGQQVQGDIGPQDLMGAYKNAADASYGQATSRLDPQFAQSENELRTRLANQGLSQNDTAYATALQNFQQGKNDAYNQANFSAQNQGLNAENTLFGQSATQGQFHNQAAGQQYSQNQGQAGFANATAGQDFSQNQQAAQFNNQAQNQTYNQELSRAGLANAARQQGLQERAYLQNEPINQFTGLLGLGQVGMPQGIQYTPSQVANTDVIGAQALSTQAAQAAANAKAQQSSALMGGLFSLGSAALMGSDRRLKRDVRLIRRRKDGVGVYRFRYRAGGPEQVGVMAQELRRVRPDLVVRRADGFLAVNYAGLDLEAA